MAYKTFLGLLVSLLLASNALAFSSRKSITLDVASNISNAEKVKKPVKKPDNATAPKSPKAVPELDGSMAVMALGLTLALGGLIREKRRSR